MTKVQESLMTIQATPNEVIAMNAVITSKIERAADIQQIIRARGEGLDENGPNGSAVAFP